MMMAPPNNTRTFWKNLAPAGVEVLGLAGSGHRSQWFQARQRILERQIALKNLRPLLAAVPSFRHKFLEAARAGAALTHPAALSIVDVYPENCSIAVEWCPGTPFSLLEHKLAGISLLHTANEIALCLAEIHSDGRAHGNLSPGNIFLCENDVLRVSDFFQPPVMKDGELRYTGDENFIAPEVLAGAGPDWRADYYSLGKILFFVAQPDGMSDELRQFAEGLTSPDPSLRGSDPLQLSGTLSRLLQLEKIQRASTKEGLGIEKRFYKRLPVDLPIKMTRTGATPSQTRSILSKALNVAESGVFIQTSDTHLAPGTIVDLEFGAGEDTVKVLGIIRWISQPPLCSGVGVQFMEVAKCDIGLIRKYLLGDEP